MQALAGQGTPSPDKGQEAAQQARRIQELIRQLADEKRHAAATVQLERLGKAAAMPLLQQVTGGETIEASILNRRALAILGSLGPDAAEAYPGLSAAIGNSDPEIFIGVLHTLGTLAPYTSAQGNQQAATGIVQSGVQVIRRLNAQDRARYGGEYVRFTNRVMVDPSGGVPMMVQELRADMQYRREVAAEVLGRMGPRAREALPVLAEKLRRAMRMTPRETDAQVLRRGRAERRRILVQQRRQDDFAATAAAAILKIAPGDPLSAPAWTWRLRHDADEHRRCQAALALGGLGGSASTEVPALIAALRDESHRVRCEVITALGMVGAAAQQAIPKLLELGASDDKAIAVRAKAALKQIGKKESKSL